MNALSHLQRLFGPLVERTKRRVERVRKLQAEPATEQTTKAIAAEQREIQLFTQLAEGTEQLVEALAATAQQHATHAESVVERFQEVVEEASHYERVFMHALLHPVGELDDEKWPKVAERAMLAMYRMNHLRTSPETYAATFPLPFSQPAHVLPVQPR